MVASPTPQNEIKTQDSAVKKDADEISNLVEASDSNDLDKIKCIAEAITEAVKGTNYAKAWEEVKKQIAESFEHIKACKTEKSPLGVAK